MVNTPGLTIPSPKPPSATTTAASSFPPGPAHPTLTTPHRSSPTVSKPLPPHPSQSTQSPTLFDPRLRQPAQSSPLPAQYYLPQTQGAQRRSSTSSQSTNTSPTPPASSGPPSASSREQDAVSTSSRVSVGSPTTPRKRFVVKGARSPRAVNSPSRRVDARSTRARPTERPPLSSERPTLSTTMSYLLAPIHLLLAPLQTILSPLLWHMANAIVLLVFVTLTLYLLLTQIQRTIAGFIGSPGNTSLPATVALFPLRTLATPTCLLVNLGCPLSLLGSPNATAQPFWRLVAPRQEIDIASVSRGLSKEVRNAKDIFDSLLALGDGRMADGLGHVKIHELGIAIQTGSTLDERLLIGQELIDLSDIASDITDEIVMINTMSVSVFSWLFWEFSHTVQLLSLPPADRPSSVALGARLDSLIARLDVDLDRLFQRVAGAIPLASRGTDMGWRLHTQLKSVEAELKTEQERYPGWQRALDVSRQFFAGGDPSKLTRIKRDLDITLNTITSIAETRTSLERVRIDLIAFRDQVKAFSASVIGMHLGASESVGLGPEAEMRILGSVVEELGVAVGRAKRRPAAQEIEG